MPQTVGRGRHKDYRTTNIPGKNAAQSKEMLESLNIKATPRTGITIGAAKATRVRSAGGPPLAPEEELTGIEFDIKDFVEDEDEKESVDIDLSSSDEDAGSADSGDDHDFSEGDKHEDMTPTEPAFTEQLSKKEKKAKAKKEKAAAKKKK